MEHVNKSHVRIVTITCIFLSSLIQPAMAASTAKPQAADVRLRQVALFKNGLGFIVSQVKIPENEESFRIVPSVAPSHGTFWVAYPAEVKFRSLIAKEVDTDEVVDAVTISELLTANVGSEVRLYLSDKDDSMIKGVIKSVTEDREIPQPKPYAPGRADYNQSRYGPYVQPSAIRCRAQWSWAFSARSSRSSSISGVSETFDVSIGWGS